MMPGEFTDAEVRAALALEGGSDVGYRSVATDTRALAPGALFVAIGGERFDGHDFLAAARDAGAAGAVVRRGTAAVTGLVLYPVDDTVRALGQLANARRRRGDAVTVAITGQNGKTSTKEMVGAVLGTRWTTYRTRANLNNLIGVPMTILEAPPGTGALVVEAGANLPGEIARYREIIDPDVAMVLNAGAGHLEGFGSVEGVVREKLSLLREVPLAIVGVQPPELPARARALTSRVITAGVRDADTVPDYIDMSDDGRPIVRIDGQRFRIGARGRHQAGNAMFAWALVREFGLDVAAAAHALETITIPGGRGEWMQHGRLTVINDSYNANPQSFATAIALARDLREGRRLVFVAGTMRELGEHSERLHDEVSAELAALGPEILALVGDFVPAFRRHEGDFHGELITSTDAERIAPILAGRLRGNELVILKGSRGAALERILPAVLARAATTN